MYFTVKKLSQKFEKHGKKKSISSYYIADFNWMEKELETLTAPLKTSWTHNSMCFRFVSIFVSLQ